MHKDERRQGCAARSAGWKGCLASGIYGLRDHAHLRAMSCAHVGGLYKLDAVSIETRASRAWAARRPRLGRGAVALAGLLVLLAARAASSFLAAPALLVAPARRAQSCSHHAQVHVGRWHRCSSAAWFRRRSGATMVFPGPGPADLLSRAAEVGLKLKMRSFGDVAVSVDSAPAELFAGKVKGVTVVGSNWASPKDLTCRELRCEVGATAIDLPRLVQRQEISMLEAGRGSATITFSSKDWANFLVHPLVTAVTPQLSTAMPQLSSASASAPFIFLRQGRIEAGEQRALFAGTFQGRTLRFALRQRKDGPGALVRPLRSEEVGVAQEHDYWAQQLSEWFSNLEIDLDG